MNSTTIRHIRKKLNEQFSKIFDYYYVSFSSMFLSKSKDTKYVAKCIAEIMRIAMKHNLAIITNADSRCLGLKINADDCFFICHFEWGNVITKPIMRIFPPEADTDYEVYIHYRSIDRLFKDIINELSDTEQTYLLLRGVDLENLKSSILKYLEHNPPFTKY